MVSVTICIIYIIISLNYSSILITVVSFYKQVVIKAGTERNGINWSVRYSSFIEQTLYFYDSNDITNLFRLLYKKH